MFVQFKDKNMKTIVLGMLFALSCNYCFAQLKIEKFNSKTREKDVYDVSQDLYIRESHRGRFNDSLDYKSYHKFINQRIFCISDEAFAPYGNRYALKRQLVNLPTPIKGCIQYKKKQLDFSINQIATYLYHPIIKSVDPQSSNVKVIDDMRGIMLIGPVMRRTIKTGNLIQWFYIMHTLLIML